MGAGSATPQGGGGNVGEVAGYWTTIIDKSGDQNDNLGPPVQPINDFDNISLAEGVHHFELRMIVEAPDTEGFIFDVLTTGTVNFEAWGKQTTELKNDALATTQSFTIAGRTFATVIMQGIVEFGSGGGTFTARFSALAAAGLSTIKAGSTLSIR